jgi:uncharacterized membrane protein YqaE (UPF0057 family)
MSDSTQNKKSNMHGVNVYVSKRHYSRKQQIEDKQRQDMKKEMKNSGIIALIMMYVWDLFVEIVVGFIFDIFDIMFFSFDYTYTQLFGNYSGVFPDVEKYGMMFSYKTIRYIITLILPPVGIFMGKGLFGWFNILVCLILCYVNYVAGIIYAFLVTMDNRYADRFERIDVKRVHEMQNEVRTDEEEKNSRHALLGSTMFILIFITIIIGFLSYF